MYYIDRAAYRRFHSRTAAKPPSSGKSAAAKKR
jgi:hypothetical protein